MNKSSISQIAILCGLALGVMALWAGAAPIGVSGDQIIGGWWAASTDTGYIGCVSGSQSDCDPCSGTTYVSCYDGPENDNGWSCYGGSFYAAVSGAGATPHATGGTGVCEGGHPRLGNFCEDYLQGAVCN